MFLCSSEYKSTVCLVCRGVLPVPIFLQTRALRVLDIWKLHSTDIHIGRRRQASYQELSDKFVSFEPVPIVNVCVSYI